MVSSNSFNPTPDNFILQIKFEDGSIGTINYFSNGSTSYPKERIEVFCNENVHIIDNFKSLKNWGSNKVKNINNFRQDKGQLNCVNAFISSIKSGTKSPIRFDEILEVHNALLNVSQNL